MIANWKSLAGQSKPDSEFLKEEVDENVKQEILDDDIKMVSINNL